MHNSAGVDMSREYCIDRKMISEQEAKQYVEESLERMMGGVHGRMKATFSLLDIKPQMRVLDVGCGLGTVVHYLASANPGAGFCGVDINGDFVELANRYAKLPNIEYRRMDMLKNDFDEGIFDYVLFLETIEHVDCPMVYVREFFRILKPGGCLVVTTPNAIGVTNIQLNLRHMHDLKKIEDEERDTGTEKDHIYCWDKLTLFRLLNRAGLKYVSHSTSNLSAVRSGQSIVMKVQKPVE